MKHVFSTINKDLYMFDDDDANRTLCTVSISDGTVGSQSIHSIGEITIGKPVEIILNTGEVLETAEVSDYRYERNS
jgi:hypothetical protein